MNIIQRYFFLIALFFSFTCFEIISANRNNRRLKNYSGYQVYHLYDSNLDSITRLEDVYARLNVDVWQMPSLFSNQSTVMVAGENAKEFRNILEELGLRYKIQIEDVQVLINKDTKTTRKRHPRNERSFRLNRYHTYTDILRWMKRFSTSRRNRELVSLLRVGTTFEGRTIFGMRISLSRRRKKPVIWQDSLIHAREWISGATLLWVVNKFVADYRANNSVIVKFLKSFDFIFVPVWNVDGYIYSWHYDRLWRKSRKKNSWSACKGVDLNRNFETPNLSGVNFCSAIYRGTAPFSEPETESVSRYLRKLNMAAYITVHSYFQLWMYPYGYKESPSPDHDELNEASALAIEALNLVHNSTYNHGSVHNSAYMVAGGSVDWVYDSLCVKHSYAVELRDKGEHGFLLPPDQIVPTAEEYYAGFKELTMYLLTTNSFRSGTCTCRQKLATKTNRNQTNCSADQT